MIQHIMAQFFGVGQSLPLFAFCNAKGFKTSYQKIRRRVNDNSTLKSIQENQSNAVGFTVCQSTSALNIISAVSSASPRDPSPMDNPDAKSARKSPVATKEELVAAIQVRQQECWDNDLKQDEKRNKLLEDKVFKECCGVLFLFHPETCVKCNHNTLIYMCPGPDHGSSCPHKNIACD